MHPILFSLGSFQIHTYGALTALAFFISVFWAERKGKKVGILPEQFIDLGFYILIFAVLGGRLLFVITELPLFIEHPNRILNFWEGGLVFYGGLIGGSLAAIVYIKLKKMNLYVTFDILVLCFTFTHILGRLGCFAAGCCYGSPTNLPWGVTFPPGSLAPAGTILHPAQLYSVLGNFVLLVFLMRTYNKRKFDGQVTLLYFIFYSVLRFILELFRDDPRGFVIEGWLTTSQFIGIPIFILSVYLYWRRWKRE